MVSTLALIISCSLFTWACLPPVFPAIGNGLRPNRLGTFSYPSPAKRLRVKTASIERFPETETNQDINLAADPGMTADEEAARHMHN